MIDDERLELPDRTALDEVRRVLPYLPPPMRGRMTTGVDGTTEVDTIAWPDGSYTVVEVRRPVDEEQVERLRAAIAEPHQLAVLPPNWQVRTCRPGDPDPLRAEGTDDDPEWSPPGRRRVDRFGCALGILIGLLELAIVLGVLILAWRLISG